MFGSKLIIKENIFVCTTLLTCFPYENGEGESPHLNVGSTVKRYPLKFPCSLLEFYREPSAVMCDIAP